MRKPGFSLVELMVVVAVVVLLATMTAFFVSNWRTDAAETEVKNDLIHASSTLENYNNFNSAYPANQTVFSSLHKNSDNVTLSYVRRASGTFCLNARSTERPAVQWYIDSSLGASPRSGTCS